VTLEPIDRPGEVGPFVPDSINDLSLTVDRRDRHDHRLDDVEVDDRTSRSSIFGLRSSSFDLRASSAIGSAPACEEASPHRTTSP
jgi:hypothetical protein